MTAHLWCICIQKPLWMHHALQGIGKLWHSCTWRSDRCRRRMVEFSRRVFLDPRFLWLRKYYFCTPQSCPPCQRLVGNLLWVKGQGRTLFVLCRTHLEFIPRWHQGTILPRSELWGQVHPMDHAAELKGSRCAWTDEFVRYPTQKFVY